ncbi:MAG TPA: tRNA pseudouridine(55) synthase TruB [Vicinamibacterales bacterium]|nr:tRNA pseudouridine(55) synthase TruB [Vicinamibacterales bacterium]
MDGDGALLVDKPAGPTSHDIVAIVRRALQTPRVGHTGTLDPLATGLLVLLVGQATRCAQFLVADEKEYIADVRLGMATETYDADPVNFRLKAQATEGVVDVPRDPGGFRLQAEDLDRVLAEFRGSFRQTPPPYSAKKVDGVRAYKSARRNQAVDLKPVDVTVHELDIIPDASPSSEPSPRDSDLPPRASDLAPRAPDLAPRDPDTLLRLRIVCSAGFYVRSLAHDIGQRLGCGAHLEALRRTRVGRFSVADAISLAELDAQGPMTQARLIPLNTLLADMPAVTLNAEGVRRVAHGNTLAAEHLTGPLADMAGHPEARVLDADGRLLAVAERSAGGLLHPILVLR